MTDNAPSARSRAAVAAQRRLREFHTAPQYMAAQGRAGVFDFSFGNPHEPPPDGFVAALAAQLEPRTPSWYAYKLSEPAPRQAVAKSLSDWRGMPFDPADVALTSGAFGALAAAFAVTLDPGDEAIYSLPPWFGYESMIATAGATPVGIPVRPEDFDPDIDAIEAAITPRTRLVIVNSPNNPTGRIHPRAVLERLAAVVDAASLRHGRRIWMISDEPYARLLFDGNEFESLTAVYPWTLLTYSYGKVLLTPGQRVGFLALSPLMPEADRVVMREAIEVAQIAGGWLFPNALLQHALPDLDVLSVDLVALQAKRDLFLAGLRDIGYRVHTPQSTFYLLPRSPIDDDEAFCRLLADEDIFVISGAICQIPGYFRICFTPTEATIRDSLPGFARAFARARDGA